VFDFLPFVPPWSLVDNPLSDSILSKWNLQIVTQVKLLGLVGVRGNLKVRKLS